MGNQETEWGEWWECGESGWEYGECGESGWKCRECGESGWEWGESGWECGELGWELWEYGWECGECGESGWNEGNKGEIRPIGVELMNYLRRGTRNKKLCVSSYSVNVQRQSSIGVLHKGCSAKTQQIYCRSSWRSVISIKLYSKKSSILAGINIGNVGYNLLPLVLLLIIVTTID